MLHQHFDSIGDAGEGGNAGAVGYGEGGDAEAIGHGGGFIGRMGADAGAI